MSFTDAETCCDGCKHLIYEKETNFTYCDLNEDPVSEKEPDEETGRTIEVFKCLEREE